MQRDGAAAKLWLGPVSLAGSIGFNVAELRAITRIVSRNEHLLRESWYDFFRQ